MALEDIRTVPAKEFKLHFGAFREAALTEPIGVTNHGRISTVMISAKEFERYERLKQLDNRRALHPSELPPQIIAQMEDEGYQGEETPELDHLLK
jgi:PHD/YefM family antitoxin component YafN of YafNO toxin-antitoxin module